MSWHQKVIFSNMAAMAKPGKTVAMRQLDALGISYSVHWQDKPTYDVEEAAHQRNLPLQQIVKSLLVVSASKRYYLVLLQGHRMLSLHKLGTVLGQKGLSMARHEDVATVTGYEPGAVSPLGLRRRIPIVADAGILAEEMVSISGGRHDLGLTLKPADLVRATYARVADIAQ